MSTEHTPGELHEVEVRHRVDLTGVQNIGLFCQFDRSLACADLHRELARILFITFGAPIDHKTVKTLWQESSIACQGRLALWDYHAHPDRYQARLQVVKLYYQGWEKVSISRFLHVSRPTVDAWIQRFETEHFAGLVDRSRAPKAPARKVWLPLTVQVYHLQKAHPDAGRFRLWSLLARPDISVRTIGRVMALSKLGFQEQSPENVR